MLPLDVIPVRVDHSDGRTWTGCRVMVDRRDKIGIWQGDRDLAYAAQSAAGVVSLAPKGTPAAAGPWTLDVPDGTLTVTREGGCGCGSPLKVLGEMDLARVTVTA